MKSYLIKHFITAFIYSLLLLFLANSNIEVANIQKVLWLSFGFLNLLFIFFFALTNSALKMKSQSNFMTFFGIGFGIKFFAALGWMVYFGLVEGIKSNQFILLFFGAYLSFTFTVMIEIWFSTKKK